MCMGVSDLHLGVSDLHLGVSDLHLGVSDLHLGHLEVSDLHLGVSDLHLGVSDLHLGVSDLHLGFLAWVVQLLSPHPVHIVDVSWLAHSDIYHTSQTFDCKSGRKKLYSQAKI